MKKIKHFFPIILAFMMSCGDSTDVVPTSKLLVSIISTYAKSNTLAEVNVITSQNPLNINEIGVVWATKSNPTTADNRQSVGGINNVLSYALKLENLASGATYYLRAYYVAQGVTTYSSDEVVFTQNYDPNWSPLPSPVISPGSYILPSGGMFSGSGGGIVYYAVDKATNIAKTIFFYPGVDDWELRYYNRETVKDAPMRFEPFKASYILKTPDKLLPVTLRGGGYYKQADGKKFFLKDFRIENVDGYTFNPAYPGVEVVTSGFGIDGNGYVLENTSKGRLWKYGTKNFQWEAVNTVPIAKEAKFISFETGERVFVLPEPNNWSEDLDAIYEYLPNTNEWKQMAAFKGENRRRGLSFVYKGKLYYGAGQSTKTLKGLRDIWEYNPTTNVWRQIATYPGTGTLNLVTLVLSNTLYIGFGQQVVPNENKGEGFTDVGDFWRFTIR
jgi:hypothetical protein